MPKTKAIGGELRRALAILEKAQKVFFGLEAERARLAARIAEIDAVLAQLPRGGASGAPPPKRRGRPPKSASGAAPEPARAGVAAGGTKGKTVREVVLSALTKDRSVPWSVILERVKRERPDVSLASVGPIVAKLRQAGEVKVTGAARDYRYLLGA